MNPIAEELNETIIDSNPFVFEMLSDMGKSLFFPKGILTQSAEAKEKANKINATIGIAKEGSSVLCLPSITKNVSRLSPDQYLPYAPSYGILELRKKWKRDLLKKNPGLENKHISLPVVTSGITHGVSCLSDLWVNKSDCIVLPDMMWGNYNMTFCVRNSGSIIHYKAFDDDLSKFNINSFRQIMEQQAAVCDKIITILNFPHNPSGYSASVAEADQIVEILFNIADAGTNIVAACDDAYFGLFYEDETLKESIFSKLTGLHERIVAIKLDGATKEDYVWGFRTGFITYGIKANGNPDNLYDALEKKTAGCIRGNISNASALSQAILLESMKDPDYDTYKKEKFELLKARAIQMKDVLKDSKYKAAWDVYPLCSHH